MIEQTLRKLETLKAKNLKVTVDRREKDYDNLCQQLRLQNYAFDIKPGKKHSVIFHIKTKWQKK